MEKIRLGMQNLGSFLDDIECMILVDSALPVEMIFEICNVRLALFCFGKELLVGRDVHGRGLNLQTHSRHARKTKGIPSVRLYAWVKGMEGPL